MKEVSQKRIYTILSPLCKSQEKCKLIYSDRRQISNCLGKDGWKGQVDRITKVHTATSGDNNTFIHLIVAMVLGVHEYIVCVCVCVCVCVRACAHPRTRSCLTLCYLTDCRPPDSSVHGISQPRILEWVPISFSKRSSRPRDGIHISWVSCIGSRVIYQLSHQLSPHAYIKTY